MSAAKDRCICGHHRDEHEQDVDGTTLCYGLVPDADHDYPSCDCDEFDLDALSSPPIAQGGDEE